jgi:hypothetical protein
MSARDALTAGVRGLLRSRVGVALLLTGLVLAVILVAQLAGGGAGGGLPIPDGRPASTVAPTAGDDGIAGPSPTTVARPGTAAPAEVAEAFATAWVDHREVSADAWRERMRPHATETLTQLLADVDPAAVPADRITGPATTVALSDMLVEVAWPVDTGVLRLRLTAPDGHWLVDWVAWDRQ